MCDTINLRCLDTPDCCWMHTIAEHSYHEIAPHIHAVCRHNNFFMLQCVAAACM